MQHFWSRLAASTAALGLMAMVSSAQAGTLVINSNTSDPAPKAGFEEMIAKFQEENPDIEVKFNVFDHEGFKTSVRNFLSSEAPDVITWFAGNRMKVFVDRGLLEDVSDVWANEGLEEKMASSLSAMTVDGKQWGVPYAYYQWGIYYRKDLFEQVGAEVPTTWDEFLEVGQKLNDAGIKPVTIGTKFLWTAAGWFDYLNIRTNGLDFHIELTDGKIPYTDDRVKKTFEHWKQLIDAGFFIDNHATYSWQEAQPFLYQGNAAMYLIGNFIVPQVPEEMVENIGFFQFPVIDPAVGIGEDAPTDTIHIPARAQNKEDARKFLAFVARADVQGPLNATIGNLPPNAEAEVPEDRFLQQGFEMLAKADGLAQFYDRDTDPEMAKIGMQGFQEFMVKPDRLDTILTRLEKARQRIFKAS
ncbi:MAG: ABC transporter substrate-binding protein [Geminicoccaceae bacterium]